MEGWKTKTGAILIGIAGVLAACSGVLPAELLIYAEWFKFVEIILASSGAALTAVGIAHKVEKAACVTCGK